MKIRNGFVSNSSSSSFCIIGKDRNFEDLDLEMDIKRENIFSTIATLHKTHINTIIPLYKEDFETKIILSTI